MDGDTQIFDDGSTLTTDTDGGVTSTNATDGNTSGDDYDYWSIIGINPNSISTNGTPPTNEEIWNQIQGGGSWLSRLGDTALDGLKRAFTKKVNGQDVTDWRSVAGAAGGLYGLYQSQNQRPERTGYQGGIPEYTAVREQVANTYDPERRPGSGSQRYFTDTKFVKPTDAEAARTTAKEEAVGLEALNKANPARQERSVLQAGSEKKEAGQGPIFSGCNGWHG